MENDSLFNNRVAILATMHQKERVIAPLLERELGIKVILPENFNTDAFGTFTRDIERSGTQIEAARLKAQKALELTGETLAIASEGSFGPHPAIPFISSNREIVILLDKQNDLEIIGEELSTDTNHNHLVVQNIEQALKFALKVGFPSHALVVMPEKTTLDSNQIIKGIADEEKLKESVEFVINNSRSGKAHVETDMRAMFNPTRMNNIEKATRNLLNKINSRCPNCNTPGYEIVDREKGLPCAACYLPTSLTRCTVYKCKKCSFRQEKLFPDGREFADPAQCMYCNP